MAGKISEMSVAAALDGSELIEVVQSGANVKTTVNDLLPVQLQGDKTIDLNGKVLKASDSGVDLLTIDHANFLYDMRADDGANNLSRVSLSAVDASNVSATIHADNGVNEVNLVLDALTNTVTLSGVFNLPTQSAPASPNDGDIWREDNTNTGLKIRINGVTKTITVS